MRLAVLAFVLVCISAPCLQAGAWLRETGTTFASATLDTTQNDGSSTSFYAEYGLSDNMTLGLDIHYDTDLLNYVAGTDLEVESIEDLPSGSGIVFLRFPLSAPDAKDKFAFHVGLGARYLENEVLKAAEVGAAWGRGIQIGERYGWLNVDVSYNAAESPALARIKLDGTAGLGFTETTKIMLQLFNTFVDGERFTKIAPSFLYSPRARNVTYQVGSEIPVDGGEATLKLGVWYSF